MRKKITSIPGKSLTLLLCSILPAGPTPIAIKWCHSLCYFDFSGQDSYGMAVSSSSSKCLHHWRHSPSTAGTSGCMYIVIQHFFSQWPGSESVLITSCGPYISYNRSPSSFSWSLFPATCAHKWFFCSSDLGWPSQHLACDARWSQCSTGALLNVHPRSSQGLLFALMTLCSHLSHFLSVDYRKMRSIRHHAQLVLIVVSLVCLYAVWL